MVLVFKGTGLFSSVFTSLGEATDLNSRLDVLLGLCHKHTVFPFRYTVTGVCTKGKQELKSCYLSSLAVFKERADVVLRDMT